MRLTVLFTISILAIFAGAAHLTLTENSGVNRSNEVVSVSIPLKMGEVPNQVMGQSAPLGIAGIPAQFKVLSTWYDGSARFVLATFKQDFSANESKRIDFGKGAGDAASGALTITDRNDTVTINTGVISVEMLKGKRFNVVNRTWRNGTLVVDNSGAGGLRIKQYRDGVNDSLDFRGEALADSFIVEENGPVRSCVYVVGRFYNDTIQMRAAGAVPCNTDKFKQPPPYIRFMVRVYTFANSDEIKISTVLHNSGQNGSQGTGAGSGGPFTFTLLDTMSKTFSLCEDSPQRLWFSEFYYDMKTVLGNSRTVTTENGVTTSIGASDRFSFLQGSPESYHVMHNGSQLANGTQGMGYIDVKNGSVGLAAALKYCWEAYPKRLDVLGDTLRINLFPRDISPETRYHQSLTTYSTKNTAYTSRFDSCYTLAPGSWYRSDVAFRIHGGDCNPQELSKRHRNPIMPRYDDQYLHATGAIPGFYSDTLRHLYPAGSLGARLVERKRQWSGIMYDYDMTEEPYNSGGRLRESLWEFWSKDRNSWGENNMGDVAWTGGYSNLHYDLGVGLLHSFLRTGHHKAWVVADLLNHRRHTQTVYHHENGHPYVDGHSRYEKDDHGSALTSNRASHCWSEGIGLYYALTGDPFVGDAFKKSVDGAVWFIARAYSRQLQNMYAADGEIRYYGWPLLKLCSGVWYRYEPAYYGVMVHLFDKMIVPMEKRMGPGFMTTEDEWSQMQGYMVPPLTFLHQTLKPTETAVIDTLKQMIYRLYERVEAHVERRGGDNLRVEGYFYQPRYIGINALDNMGHTDTYAFVAKHFNKPEARIQGLVNAMSMIGYHQRFTTSRDSAAHDYYSRALFRSNAFPGTETKLHGKIGLHGRVMFGYEYDSLCPVMPGDGSLTTVAAEKNIALTSAELAVVGVRPNPFNPSTKILFNLPSTHINTEIKMTVYDMAGRIVNRISKSFPTHGSVFIEWNGKDAKGATVASGVYFASITSANAKQSLVKLTLMK